MSKATIRDILPKEIPILDDFLSRRSTMPYGCSRRLDLNQLRIGERSC